MFEIEIYKDINKLMRFSNTVMIILDLSIQFQMLKYVEIFSLDFEHVPTRIIVEKLFDESNKKAIIFIG